jgi:YD repeat-containing protein
VLRQRTGVYDSFGNLTTQTSVYSATNALTTSLTWDSYGNLISESDDAGYVLNYTYDPVLYALATQVTDSLGQSTSWTYDYSRGLELSQTDTNGQTIRKTYDSFGRMTGVRSPYDTGSVPALSFSYNSSSYPWTAVTENKVSEDPDDSQTIATAILTDGLGRMIQTKKQSLVTDPTTGNKTPGWNILVVRIAPRTRRSSSPVTR